MLGLITGSDNDIPRAAGRGRNDRAVFHLASLFREDNAVRNKLLTLEKSKLSVQGHDLLVRTLLQAGTEEALFSCLDAMNASGLDGYTAYQLHERFEEMFVKHAYQRKVECLSNVTATCKRLPFPIDRSLPDRRAVTGKCQAFAYAD